MFHPNLATVMGCRVGRGSVQGSGSICIGINTAKYPLLLPSPQHHHARAARDAGDAHGWSTGWRNASAPQNHVPKDAEELNSGKPGLA